MARAASVLRGAGLALAALLGLAALAAAVVSITVGLLGGSPQRALLALVAGSVGTPSSLAETLIKMTPLVFTGLGIAVAFRCGIWNIGAEGQFLMGMLGASVAALYLPPGVSPLLRAGLALLAGCAAGLAWSVGPALLRLRRDVPEVISTIMLNFLAVYLIQYLVSGPMKDPRSASAWSPLLPAASYLPRLSALGGARTVGGDALRLPDGQPVLALGLEAGRLHLGVLLALAAVILAWAWLARSAAGFQIRAVGFNPVAARTAGIPVARTVMLAFLASGGLAGLGGAVEVLGLIQRMYRYDPGSPGYGFSGIAVALLGQLHPVGVLGAALFFGALNAGSSQMQRVAGVSFQVAYVVQAVVVLLLVCIPSGARLPWLRRKPSGAPVSAEETRSAGPE